MIIQVRAGGLDDNFSYLAWDDATLIGFIVDPCGDTDKLLAAVRANSVTVKYVINTHGHHDHSEGNDAVLAVTGAQLVMHRLDAPRGSTALLVDDGATLIAGGNTLTAIHTPGHTAGSICLRFGDGLFTGDTLFVDYCGLASDPQVLYRSLHTVLRALPDELIVYAGHNYGATPTATLGHEKQHNPYLQAQDYASWLARYRMMN